MPERFLVKRLDSFIINLLTPNYLYIIILGVKGQVFYLVMDSYLLETIRVRGPLNSRRRNVCETGQFHQAHKEIVQPAAQLTWISLPNVSIEFDDSYRTRRAPKLGPWLVKAKSLRPRRHTTRVERIYIPMKRIC